MNEAEILKGYLLHKGMREVDAHHYMQRNAQQLMGGGVLDFFKKHKKAILKGLAAAAGLVATGVAGYNAQKHYRNQQNTRNRMNELLDMRAELGGGIFNDFINWIDTHKDTIMRILKPVGKRVVDIITGRKTPLPYGSPQFVEHNQFIIKPVPRYN